MKPSERLDLELSKRSETYIRNHNLAWFNEIYVSRKIEPMDKMSGEPFVLGRLYTFLYDDPKYKDELDFYSTVPVSMFIGFSKNAPDNPMMINVHFIPPQYRRAIFDKIYEINKSKIRTIEYAIDHGKTSDRELSTTYYDLQKYLVKSGFGFAIRSYIIDRIKTEPLIIAYRDWWRILSFANQHVMKQTIMQIYNSYKSKLDSNWKPFKKEEKIKL